MHSHYTLGLELGRGREADAVRYALLSRFSRALGGRAHLLAYGFGSSALHLVVEGEPDAVRAGIGRIRCSVAHRVGVHAALDLRPPDDLIDAVAEAHRAATELGDPCPLASPWSSHRDVLGYRTCPFYDPTGVTQLDRRELHARAGGRPLPRGWTVPAAREEPLNVLFTVACEVQGHLPGDRRAFPLFAQLARERGWRPCDVASALRVTPRRVHQLYNVPRQHLDVARRWLRHRHAVPHEVFRPPLLAVPVEHAQRLVARPTNARTEVLAHHGGAVLIRGFTHAHDAAVA